MAQLPLSLALTCLFILGSVALGVRLLKNLGLDASCPITVPAAAVLGLSFISYLILALGEVRLLKALPLQLCFWAVSALFFYDRKKIVSALSQLLKSLSYEGDKQAHCLIGVFLLALALLILNALKPETYFDTLVYHLGLPEMFLQEQSTRPIPHHFFSTMTVFKEMIFAMTLTVQGEVLTKLIAVAWSGIAPFILLVWGYQRQERCAGWAAAILFMTTPLVFTATRRTVSEPILTGFLLLALHFAFFEVAFSNRWGQAVTAGLFTGLTVAFKYFSGIWCIFIFLMFIYSVRKESDRLSRIFYFTLGSLLPLLPWFLRTGLALGDPFYPYLSAYLGKLPYMEGWRGFLVEVQHWYLGLPRGLSDLAILIKASFFDHTGAFFAGPSYLILLPAVFLAKQQSPSSKRLGLFTAIAWIVGLSQTHYIRYLIPPLAPLAFLICSGISQVPRGRWSQIFRALFSFFIVFHIFWMLYGFRHALDQKVMLGRLGRSFYLQKKLGYWDALDWINQNTPPEASVLVLGETRSYGFKRRVVLSTVHDRHPWVNWVQASPNLEALRRQLKAEGITHIFYHRPEAERIAGYGGLNLDARGRNLWENFISVHLRIAYEDGSVTIYELF